MRILFFVFSVSTLFATATYAQNTGGIFPPMVDEGHASIQYRLTYDTSGKNAAQRIHYQQAINDDLMWRIVLQTKHPSLFTADFHYLQGELFWEFSPKASPLLTGVRFDARVQGSGAPFKLGLHWTNQLRLLDRLHLRGIAFSTYDVGSKEIGLQTRGSVFYNLQQGPTLGVEFYNAFGTTGRLKPLAEQSHQIGPFAFVPLSPSWNLFVGLLAGLTPGSAELELRSWLTVNL